MMEGIWKKRICLMLSLLMLLSACVSCTPSPKDPVETPPAPSAPAAPSSSSSSSSSHTDSLSKLEAKGTDVYFSAIGFDNDCMTYVTYNGYHNPVEERSVSLENPLLTWVTTYEYNHRGKLTKLEAKTVSYEKHAAKEMYYSASFTDQDPPTASFAGEVGDLSAKVEYHKNGTIKSWAILLGESYVKVGMEQDPNGRRTKYREGGKTVTYSYADPSRAPDSVLYEDTIFSTPDITLTYTDGQLSALAGMNETTKECFAVTLTHTSDGKYPASIVFCEFPSYLQGYDQHTYQMTYTDTGHYASLSDFAIKASTDYEITEKETYTFVYDAQGRLAERTKDIYDDPSAPDWKKSEVMTLTYDANGRPARMLVKAFGGGGSLHWSEDTAYVYDANGRKTETATMRIAYYLLEPDTILSKEKTVCEYDENGYESKRTVYTYGNPENWDEITETRVY